MKKLILIVCIIASSTSFSQVAFGKSSLDGAALIDFDSNATNTKGIILPIVTTLPTGAAATDGTLLLDSTDDTVKARVNGQWIEMTSRGALTIADGGTTDVTTNTSSDNLSSVVIGATSSSAEGVLVLESTTKAMVLPRINQPEINVKSPHPGMICYDTFSKTVAIFDGKVWNYWK